MSGTRSGGRGGVSGRQPPGLRGAGFHTGHQHPEGTSSCVNPQFRPVHGKPTCGARLPKPPGRCDNAQVTGLSVALANLKPGTGKTTSAVWLAHVFAQAGNSVLLVDADPSGSALEWSDLAAMYPQLAPPEAFPFRIVALPSRELHRRVPEIAQADSWRTTLASPGRRCGTPTRF